MDTETILKEALSLQPKKKIELIDRLLESLDEPSETNDERWAKESEDRIEAFERGRLKAVSLNDVVTKYR